MIPHKMGHKDKSVHNSNRLGGLSGRSIRAVDQGGQSGQLIRAVDQGNRQGGPWFPISLPHQLKWCDKELHFLVAGGLVGIVTGLAYTQRFPWSRNPSLKSSMGKICQDPHIQLSIDIRWGAQSPSLVLLTWDLTCDSHLNSTTIQKSLEDPVALLSQWGFKNYRKHDQEHLTSHCQPFRNLTTPQRTA